MMFSMTTIFSRFCYPLDWPLIVQGMLHGATLQGLDLDLGSANKIDECGGFERDGRGCITSCMRDTLEIPEQQYSCI